MKIEWQEDVRRSFDWRASQPSQQTNDRLMKSNETLQKRSIFFPKQDYQLWYESVAWLALAVHAPHKQHTVRGIVCQHYSQQQQQKSPLIWILCDFFFLFLRNCVRPDPSPDKNRVDLEESRTEQQIKGAKWREEREKWGKYRQNHFVWVRCRFVSKESRLICLHLTLIVNK